MFLHINLLYQSLHGDHQKISLPNTYSSSEVKIPSKYSEHLCV